MIGLPPSDLWQVIPFSPMGVLLSKKLFAGMKFVLLDIVAIVAVR
jgi:hypothetical protein